MPRCLQGRRSMQILTGERDTLGHMLVKQKQEKITTDNEGEDERPDVGFIECGAVVSVYIW